MYFWASNVKYSNYMRFKSNKKQIDWLIFISVAHYVFFFFWQILQFCITFCNMNSVQFCATWQLGPCNTYNVIR